MARPLDVLDRDGPGDFERNLRAVERIGPALAERFSAEFNGMDELVAASTFDILEQEGVGKVSAGEIQRDVQRRFDEE